MTNCCNDFGNCTQGRDCPIRKQRMKETNDAYMKMLRELDDPYEDVTASFKGLIVLMGVIAVLTLFTFWYWGKV
jgi:hypothetical protein